jgi:hypothetical protein
VRNWYSFWSVDVLDVLDDLLVDAIVIRMRMREMEMAAMGIMDGDDCKSWMLFVFILAVKEEKSEEILLFWSFMMTGE